MKLTAAAIRNHRAEEENASDDDLKNGYVRFRATGAHAYYVCHGTPRKWRKVADLAGAGALTLDQARNAAMELLTKLARGHDPAIDKAKAKVAALNTFGVLLEPYLARQRQGQAAKHRPRDRALSHCARRPASRAAGQGYRPGGSRRAARPGRSRARSWRAQQYAQLRIGLLQLDGRRGPCRRQSVPGRQQSGAQVPRPAVER